MSDPQVPDDRAAGHQPAPPPPGSGGPGQPPPPPLPGYQGYVAPSPGIPLPRIVLSGACVVLAMFAIEYLYRLSQDEYGGDFGDRLLGQLSILATGIFYSCILLAVAAWLARRPGD